MNLAIASKECFSLYYKLQGSLWVDLEKKIVISYIEFNEQNVVGYYKTIRSQYRRSIGGIS